ncbi:hypothetical protein SCL_1929 [Sulfuricaulis limicola]|uniref:Uncharacterized protein n=1 Tax=Sulfuricaulis limicola TaxID=1620215 RepID=A0A1B4XHC7_9GAMM|nr:hypothetical protein SCL_1929 [Sulfuricaulis limicola]
MGHARLRARIFTVSAGFGNGAAKTGAGHGKRPALPLAAPAGGWDCIFINQPVSR